MTPEERQLLQILGKIILSDKYLFQKPLIGGPNGLRLGSVAKDKIGFFSAAPIPQWSSGLGRSDINGDSGLPANRGTQYTGNTGIGTSAYSTGDIVAALKAFGILI